MHSNTHRRRNTVNWGYEIWGFCLGLFLNSGLKRYLYSAACFWLLYPSFISNESQHGDNKIYFHCCLPVQKPLSSTPADGGQLLLNGRVKLVLSVMYTCPAQGRAALAMDVAPGPTSDWQRKLNQWWLLSQSHPHPAARLPQRVLRKSSHDKKTVWNGSRNPLLIYHR